MAATSVGDRLSFFCFHWLIGCFFCFFLANFRPPGISQLPQATLAYLEPFRRISLWLDQGGRGWESARLFAKKLGEKRCHFVR